jgi:hypothetical protein
MGLHETKNFCTEKGTVISLKRQSIEWEKIFASYLCDKGLITRIYRDLKKLISQRINNLLKKMGKRTEQTILKRRSTNSQ